ncbi:MAG: gliding motility-associated C-terminal domain-containing protein [Lewinella sp.]|nr:gliding motility-associated C-terminal domain-containing protein [Lewinella sp.]
MCKPLSLFLLSGLFLFFLNLDLHATHNRAGEIVVELLPNEDGECFGSRTVRATIITYTKTSAVDADRDTLTLCWGDGLCDRVARVNGAGNPPQGQPLENDVKFNLYIAEHTFTTTGQYTISMQDPNRNAGVINVNFPNSVSVPFYIETVYNLVNANFQGCNSSPVLQVPPIDFACIGEVFTHNPGAYDPDGDSLSYELAVPQQDVDDPVPNFFFPNGITINHATGDLVWDAPNQFGEYNIAINIISWRNGQPLDTMVRDMQIFVENCSNEPPEIFTEVDEICVIAGSLVEFDVTATAPITDEDQEVRLLAYGAPFNLASSPATFVPNDESYNPDPFIRRFRWQTTCDHIAAQPYNVVFRAVDDFLGDSTGLAVLKVVQIKVVGPPPEDVQAVATSEQVEVSWELPYICEDAADEYFRGFTVWRRINSDQSPLDTCAPGLEGRGYTKLTPGPITDIVNGRYFYLDNNVERGRTYCYRILAEFARRTASGSFFFNAVESLPSEEVCVQLSRDVPLITKVDVATTSLTAGEIEVCWNKPLASDLDTLLNPGPYTYELLRAPGQTENPDDFSPVASFTSPTFAGANDTCYLDAGLNTLDQPYSYLLNFYVDGNDLLGASAPASSVFLNISPTDETNVLTWDELIPWENYNYVIYRESSPGVFDSLTQVSDPIYRDMGLINGVEYCYYLRAEGTYNIDGLIDPLFNRSQQACAVPIDNVPPCPPVLTVSNVCETGSFDCEDESLLYNDLAWTHPSEQCPEVDDVAGYRVYYAPFEDSEFSLVGNIDAGDQLSFAHQPPVGLAGCYALTALDSVGNESGFSNIVCVDNCPFYELPNAFTPNGDGQNDRFLPMRSCFIAEVEFEVFNRWGTLVFTTNDPDLNWDGTNSKGEELATGTYFYRCQVFERRVDGILPSPEILSGYIELIRDQP